MSRPFAALILTAGVPAPDDSVFHRGTVQTLTEPVPLLRLEGTTRTRIGEATSLSWYHHLLIAHGTATLDPQPLGQPIPVGFEAVAYGARTEPHPDPTRTGTATVLRDWRLECLIVGERLTHHFRPWGRLCAAPDHDGHPQTAYDHAWRLHPLRVSAWGDRHGPVTLSLSSTPPTRDEEALLALYADYRLAVASPGPFPDPHLLAHPDQAEHDPIRLTRAQDGTWHYARTSWGTTPTSTRPGRALATLLADVEDADGTLTHWAAYQDRHPAHDTRPKEQHMPTPARVRLDGLDRLAGATTALHLRGVDGGDYTARRDDHTHLSWTITTPYTTQDLLLDDADMAHDLLLRLAQGTARLDGDGTDAPAQPDHTWLAVPHLSDDEGEEFEFSDGPVYRVVFVHAHHPDARARFEVGACTRSDSADHWVQTRLTLEVTDLRHAEPLVYEDAQARTHITSAAWAAEARRLAKEHRDRLRAHPMTDADLWDGTRDGLEALIADAQER